MSFWIAFKVGLRRACIYWILSFLFLFGWVVVYFCMRHSNFFLQSPTELMLPLYLIFFMMVVSPLKYRFSTFERELNVIDAILKLCTVFFICYSLSPILLTTPYHNISHVLLDFDQSVGFDQSQLMLWIFDHRLLLNMLHSCYSGMFFISLLLFGVSAYFDDKSVFQSLVMVQLGLLLASIIFLFAPSTSPVFFTKETLLSKNFPKFLYDFFMQSAGDVRQISLVHQGKPPVFQHMYHAGFIAFPSIHFFMALLLIFLSRKVFGRLSYLFMGYAVLILMAILGLGEHYLLDVVGAVVLFFVCYYFSGKFILWQDKSVF